MAHSFKDPLPSYFEPFQKVSSGLLFMNVPFLSKVEKKNELFSIT